MKKLLVLLPLLLTGCASLQLNSGKPVERKEPVIRYQPPQEAEPEITPEQAALFNPISGPTINIFRAFEHGIVDGEDIRPDVLRNIDKGHKVTVIYEYNGYHMDAEGELVGLVNYNGPWEIELKQYHNVLSCFHAFADGDDYSKDICTKTDRITTSYDYIEVKYIQFVIVEYTKETL